MGNRCGKSDDRCCIGCINQENDQFAAQSIFQFAVNTKSCGTDHGSREVGNFNVTVKNDEVRVNGEKVDSDEE